MSPDSAGMGHELDAGVPVELGVFDDLLRVLSEALDVREVLPRVSAIVRRVLPHDRMLILFNSPTGIEVPRRIERRWSSVRAGAARPGRRHGGRCRTDH